jgi:hypothetical protein
MPTQPVTATNPNELPGVWLYECPRGQDDADPDHTRAEHDGSTEQAHGTGDDTDTGNGTGNGTGDGAGAPVHRVEQDQPDRVHTDLDRMHCLVGHNSRIAEPGAIEILVPGLERLAASW